MSKNEKGASAKAPIPGPEGHLSKNNSTINPDAARNAQETLNAYLPPSLSKKLNQFLAREVANYISKNQNASDELNFLLTPLATIKSAKILTTDYPPIPWLVSDYLAPGLTFLYGKPKVGKSWLSLQLALSVLSGGRMFGRDVSQGQVLYLALEDNERRLHTRMSSQGWPTELSVDFMLYDRFREQIGALNSGGGKRLLAHIEAQKYVLVLIDTFSRAILGDQLKSDEMTAAIGPLQQHAINANISLVVVDHEPKYGETPFGSVAKLGVADTFWRLYKEQGKHGAKLQIWGRDLEDEYTLKLVFDNKLYFWHCEGDASAIELTERRKEILEALETIGRGQLKEIADVVGQDKPNTYKRLQDLANEGYIIRENEGKNVFYELSPPK